MKPQLSRAVRWLSGLPTVLVAVLWLALWQAWPTAPSPVAARRSPAASQVLYRGSVARVSASTRMQLAFVQAPSAPGSVTEEVGPDALRVPRTGATGHCLDRNGSVGESPAGELPGLLSTGAAPDATFRPPFDVPRVFASRPPSERGLVLDMSDGLRERDFKVGAWTAEALQWTNSAWQVVLRVGCAEDGGVEDVFVESGTTNQAFNLALARRVQSAGKTRPGARCSGVVTVSYGEE